MIRLTYFSIIGIVIALCAYWITSNPGQVLINWQGWEIRFSVGALIILIILYTFTFLMVLKLLRWLNIANFLSNPKRLAIKRAKAENLLDQAWGSYALGDFELALKQGQKAKSANGENNSVLRLLAKVTQKLEKEENPYLEKLKLSSGNNIWVHKQDLNKQLQDKNWHAAKEIVSLMLEEHPKNPYLLKEAIMLNARLSDWENAKNSISSMEKNRSFFAKSDLNHIKAVIDYALALEEKAAGKKTDALSLLKKSLKNDPSFAPAALAAIKTLMEQDDFKTAEKILKAIWKIAPNDELSDSALDLNPQESSTETYRRLKVLCDSAPHFAESQHLLAKAAIAAKHWPEARKALDTLIGSDKASKETYMLLAKLEAKQKNDYDAETKFQKVAEQKPHGNKWLCHACGSNPQHYFPVCDECGEFDSVKWSKN